MGRKMKTAVLTLCILFVCVTSFAIGIPMPFLGANKPVRFSEDLTTGLVAYWSFDTSTVSGASVTDLSGFANTATLQASPSIVSGHLGDAVQCLSASSQYVTAANSASLNCSTSVTVSAWVKFITLPASGKNPVIVGKLADNLGYGLFFSGPASTYGIFGAGGAFQLTTAWPSAATNIWYHVCVVNEGATPSTQMLRLYVNGAEITPAITWNSDTTTNTSGITMMKHYSNSDLVNGLLDEVRIYNRPLTAAQVASLAAQ